MHWLCSFLSHRAYEAFSVSWWRWRLRRAVFDPQPNATVFDLGIANLCIRSNTPEKMSEPFSSRDRTYMSSSTPHVRRDMVERERGHVQLKARALEGFFFVPPTTPCGTGVRSLRSAVRVDCCGVFTGAVVFDPQPNATVFDLGIANLCIRSNTPRKDVRTFQFSGSNLHVQSPFGSKGLSL